MVLEDDAHFHMDSKYKGKENSRRINNGKCQLLAPTVGDLFYILYCQAL